VSALASFIELPRNEASEPSLARLATERVNSQLKQQQARLWRGSRVAAVSSVCLGHNLGPQSNTGWGSIYRHRDLLVVADARISNTATWCEGASQSDAEAIAFAYRRWGTDTAKHLRGEFAFVVWDNIRKSAYCARDALALRPLFYAQTGSQLRCASEPFALASDGSAELQPNVESVALCAAGFYHELGPSLYRGVFALEGGHQLVFDNRGMTKTAFWQPDPAVQSHGLTDEEHASRFLGCFERAVERCLPVEGKVAVALSGGIDSSAVAAQADKLLRAEDPSRRALHALHLSYADLACDERAFRQAMTDHLGIDCCVIDALDEKHHIDPWAFAHAPDILYHPGGFVAAAWMRAAERSGAGTVVTGEGGDVLMAGLGLDAFRALRAGEWLSAGRLVGLTRQPFSSGPWLRLWRQGLQHFAPDWLRRPVWSHRRPYFPLSRHWGAFVLEHNRKLQGRYRERYAGDPLAAAKVRCLQDSLNIFALGYHQRLARRYGVELRHPLLDRELVELLLSTPDRQLHEPGQTKSKPILRRASRQLLPARVYHRRHVAEFSSHWQLALARDEKKLQALFGDDCRLAQLGIIDRNFARKLNQASAAPDLYRILDLYSLELWLRQIES
jgi:asparagine synthase (glutamine-hydrolysing)